MPDNEATDDTKAESTSTANIGATQKTADRPHHYTLFVNLAAIIISSGSIYLSYRALTINERYLEIGQKAYISVTVSAAYKPDQKPTTAQYSLLIKNLGNTPAKDITFRYTLKGSGPGSIPLQSERMRDLGPRDSYEFPLAAEGVGNGVFPTYTFDGKLTFKTIFSETVTVPFCYTTSFIGQMEQCR